MPDSLISQDTTHVTLKVRPAPNFFYDIRSGHRDRLWTDNGEEISYATVRFTARWGVAAAVNENCLVHACDTGIKLFFSVCGALRRKRIHLGILCQAGDSMPSVEADPLAPSVLFQGAMHREN